MSKSFKSEFDAIDLALKDSQSRKAHDLILKLKRRKFATEDLVRFSSLCCRAGLPDIAVTKLMPVIKPSNRKRQDATTEHFIEYAVCLVRLGASREAENVLNSIATQELPAVIKARAHLHMAEWNYHLAIPLFRSHIAALPQGDYQSSLSKINLSMSLIFEGELNEAAGLLNDLIGNQENFDSLIFKGICYRVLGGLEVNRGNYEFAMQCLQKALATFADPDSLDAFLVRKWMAVSQYYLQKGAPFAKLLLDSIRQEALLRKKWESVRDIDYHLAVFHNDEQLLTKLYFGTSYPRFKERLKKRFPDLQIPSAYRWELGKTGKRKFKTFDVMNSIFKRGHSPYRLMTVLTSDFYRSFNAVDLFHGCFPSDVYLFGHSEQRVYTLSTRLRTHLSKEGLPLELDSNDNLFCLKATAPIEIIVREAELLPFSQTDHRLEELKNNFPTNAFSAQDVCSLFSISGTLARRIVREAVAKGLLLRLNEGKQSRYSFPP